MRLLGYVVLFTLIQLVSIALTIIGIPICALLAYGNFAQVADDRKWHWPSWAWIWDNREDGVSPDWYHQAHANRSTAANEFMWTALRNSANNLRYVPGVSRKGRPYFRKTWGATPGGWYVAAGWNGSGFPVMSGGRNVNAY